MKSDTGDAELQHEDLEKTAEEEVEQAYLEELRENKPSSEERTALLAEHEGHLVRDTTSQITESDDVTDDGGIKMQKTAEVPDTYCFTCEEWVGLSGVDLSGTPRSKADAYYLGGKPPEIRTAEEGVSKTLNDLADALVEGVEQIESRGSAHEFIETELEGLRYD